ncbi:bcl-2-like protein 1 [Takifugu flavidus]|uniref:bcl-2-like protein 1 n=1 Tax=Takifugu flavidus TaxID=433684 RepID=UPI002544B5D9|nr:bcl-2-like protein 1 [Takifugu flavidus]
MSNRELVENYLIYKLSQKNYPGTLLRPKDALSGLLVDRESSGASPSAGTGREAVNAALRSMANKFEQDFIQLAGDLSAYVAMTRNQESFNKVMDDMFKDEINWGTVVGLFVVGGAICVQSVECGASEPVCHIADWMTVYLDKQINPWIESQGGWDCFATIYGEEACTNRAQEERRQWILGRLVVLAGVLIIVTKNYGTLRKAFSHFMSYWS